jgi:hypothetical protein
MISIKSNGKIIEYSDESIDELDVYTQTEIAQLIILYNELTNPHIPRQENIDFHKASNYYAISVRYTRSEAIHYAIRLAKEFADENGCTLIGDPNVGCAWQDFGCVAVQAMEC